MQPVLYSDKHTTYAVHSATLALVATPPAQMVKL